MRTYTTAQRDRFAKFGDVTKNGVVFDWELASIAGAAFTLIREPHRTDADMQLAEHHLRSNRDVVSLSMPILKTRPKIHKA